MSFQASQESNPNKATPESGPPSRACGVMGNIGQSIEGAHHHPNRGADRDLLFALIDNLPDLIFAKDIEHRYILTNNAHSRFLGASEPGAVIGKTAFDFFPCETAQAIHADEQAVLHSAAPFVDQDRQIVHHDGTSAWFSATKVPLHDEQGNIVGLLAMTRDITARKEVEEKLTRANAELAVREAELVSSLADVQRSREKLEAAQLHLAQAGKLEIIGRLAAGVAHEVKNPLTILSLGIDYLTRCGSLDKLAENVVHAMKGAVKRAEVVIHGLLDFSRPGQLDIRPDDPNRVLRQAVSLVKHELTRHHIVLETKLAGDLPPAALDATKIEQVFINLFLNAIHAMSAGGTLTVRTYFKPRSTVVDDGIGDAAHDDRNGEGRIVVEIDDTGTGIPEDKLAQIFDPFFTTKPVGIGTGLGLSLSKTLIELHGGTIQITNRIEGAQEWR